MTSSSRALGLALSLVVCCGFAGAALSASGPGKSAQERASKTPAKKNVGLASYYGKGLHGKKTAGGEIFDKNEMVAAHPTYPLGTRVRVTNLGNGRSEIVRIVDRGPTREHTRRGVIIDLSERAAVKLGFRRQGKTRVRTGVIEWGERNGK